MLDVLIVGAGPTGLVAAAELLRYGLTVRVVDKLPEPSLLSRALGVHARSLEILDDMGVSGPLCAAGVRVGGVILRSGGEILAQVSLDELDSRFPFVLCLPQSETERVLAELVGRRGGRVERGVELVGCTSGDGVRAQLKHADGSEEEVSARWLVGCDGAHSLVRKQLGLDFEGAAFPEEFFLADLSVEWELPGDRIHTFFSPEGVLACFPLPHGRWRLIANVPANAPANASTPTLADLQALVEARVQLPARLSDPGWMAQFRIHTRQVARYRSNCAFLAGDAAHIHSPVGGQGMNTGMQDAHNLAWKLAHVTHGWAPPSLLDSYHAERHAVGRSLLRATDLATRAGTLRRPVARAVRDHAARFLSSLEVVQRRITRTVAELNLSYARSPIVDEEQAPLIFSRLGADDSDEAPTVSAHRRFAAGPRAGERAPDAEVLDQGVPRRLMSLVGEGRHTVLLFDGRARTEEGYRAFAHIVAALEARYRDRVRVLCIAAGGEPIGYTGSLGRVLLDPDGDAEDAFGATAECAYVIRPDLYIGHRCQPASKERLLAHFEKILLPA